MLLSILEFIQSELSILRTKFSPHPARKHVPRGDSSLLEVRSSKKEFSEDGLSELYKLDLTSDFAEFHASLHCNLGCASYQIANRAAKTQNQRCQPPNPEPGATF